MKNDDEIDNLFKNKLENTNISDIPQAYLDDITQRLDAISSQKKRRRFFPFFWFITLLGVLSSISYFTLFDHSTLDKSEKGEKMLPFNSSDTGNMDTVSKKNDNNTGLNTEVKNTANRIPETGSSIGPSNILATNQPKTMAEQRQKKGSDEFFNSTINNKTKTNTKSQNKNESEKISAHSKSGSLNTKEKSAQSRSDRTQKSGKKKSYVTQGSSSIIANVKTTKSNGKKEKPQSGDLNPPPNGNKAQISGANIDSALNITKDNVVLHTDKSDSVNMTKTSDSLVNISKADSLKKATTDTLSIAAKDSLKKDSTRHVKFLADTSNNNLKNIKTVQLLVGPSRINSSFDSRDPNYNTKRKNEENAIWVVDASLLFNDNRNRFVYSIGLNYSQWGEKINYKPTTDSVKYINKYDITYMTQQVSPNNFVVNSSLNPEYKNKAVLNNAITIHNGINKYSYINVPLLFGYQLGNSIFSITPKIGGMIGMLVTSQGGYYINPDLSALVQEKATTWLFNFRLSADLQTKLSSNMNLCVTPIYNYNITPVIHSENTVNRYNGLGVQIGVSYILH